VDQQGEECPSAAGGKRQGVRCGTGNDPTSIDVVQWGLWNGSFQIKKREIGGPTSAGTMRFVKKRLGRKTRQFIFRDHYRPQKGEEKHQPPEYVERGETIKKNGLKARALRLVLVEDI